MANPYRVLDIPQGSGDEGVRESYVSLVRRFPPERYPEKFQRIQAAYEALRDQRARLRFLLFEPGQGESLEEWMEEICETKNSRPGLVELRKVFRPS